MSATQAPDEFARFVYVDSRLYDLLDDRTHAVLQIARSIAYDHPGKTIRVETRAGEVLAQFLVKSTIA